MTDDRICRWCHSKLEGEAESLCQACVAKEEMLKEGLTTAPDLIRQEDFERFLWKLAVYAIKTMEHPEGGTRWPLEHIRNSLLIPILRALPRHYISLMGVPMDDERRVTGAPKYTIKTSIPKKLLFRTVEKLGIWDKVESDDDFTAGA